MTPAAVELNNTFLFRLKAGKKPRVLRRVDFPGVELGVTNDSTSGEETIIVRRLHEDVKVIPGENSVIDSWNETDKSLDKHFIIRSGYCTFERKDYGTLVVRLENDYGVMTPHKSIDNGDSNTG